jgi:hypothetical protein
MQGPTPRKTAHTGPTEDRLEALLLEGLNSGDPTPLDAAEWKRIRDEVQKHIKANRRAQELKELATKPRNGGQ